MKKVLIILISVACCLSACVHDGGQTNTAAYSGGSFDPAFSSDSSRNLSSATGSTGQAINPDTIPRPLAIPGANDTSQRKNLNPPH